MTMPLTPIAQATTEQAVKMIQAFRVLDRNYETCAELSDGTYCMMHTKNPGMMLFSSRNGIYPSGSCDMEVHCHIAMLRNLGITGFTDRTITCDGITFMYAPAQMYRDKPETLSSMITGLYRTCCVNGQYTDRMGYLMDNLYCGVAKHGGWFDADSMKVHFNSEQLMGWEVVADRLNINDELPDGIKLGGNVDAIYATMQEVLRNINNRSIYITEVEHQCIIDMLHIVSTLKDADRNDDYKSMFGERIADGNLLAIVFKMA